MAEFGIHPYHQTHGARADLVLVHGLMGNSTGTWTGRDDKGAPTYWPDWIKQSHPDVNIWLADYNSSLDAWLQPAMPLDQIADSLLSNANDQGLGTQPIHWVGHSMGGLIIKHLLCRAQTRANPSLHKIGAVPTAITFLGTPHHGSDVAEWKGFFVGLLTALDLYAGSGAATGVVARFRRVLEKLRNADIRSHVEQLSVHSEALGRLNDDFSQWLAFASREDRLVQVRNYFETLPVTKTVVVVPKRSAQMSNADIHDIPAQEHHLSICKYASQKNMVFIGVNESLKLLCKRFEVSQGRAGSDQTTRLLSSEPLDRDLESAQSDDRINRAWRNALGLCSANVLAQACLELKGVLGDCQPTVQALELALERAFGQPEGPEALRARLKRAFLPGRSDSLRGLSVDERCKRDSFYVMLLIQSVALTYRAAVQGEVRGELVVPDRERQFAVAAAAHIVLGLGVQLTVGPGGVTVNNLIDTAGCADAAASAPGQVHSDTPLEDELKRWLDRVSKGERSPQSIAEIRASLAVHEEKEHARPILLDTIGMLTAPGLRALVQSLDIGAVDTAAEGRPATISTTLWNDLCGQLDNQIAWLNRPDPRVKASADSAAQAPVQPPPAAAPGPTVQVNISGAVGQSNVTTGGHSPIYAQTAPTGQGNA